jgi:hypothetical protein
MLIDGMIGLGIVLHHRNRSQESGVRSLESKVKSQKG